VYERVIPRFRLPGRVVNETLPLHPIELRVGRHDGPPQLIVWHDYQCPACAGLHQFLRDRGALDSSSTVAIVFRPFPLRGHPLAKIAAAVADCSGERGRFREVDLALSELDLVGDSFPWGSLGDLIGQSESGWLRECATPARQSRIDSLAKNDQRVFRLAGTPTLLIGNRLVDGLPDEAVLDRLLPFLSAAGGRGTQSSTSGD
jgi:protein-disulfide isomerase